MTASTQAMKPGSLNPETPTERTDSYLLLAVGWHILIAVGALGGVIALWTAGIVMEMWLRVVLSVVFLLVAVFSALAALWIRRRQHRGRIVSLAINYLGFVLFFFAMLQLLGLFTGIDSLANTFGQGVPFLIIILIGYLINGVGNRYEDYPERRQRFQRAGNIIMLVGIVIFFLAVGLLQGILAFILRFNNPVPFLLLFGLLSFGGMSWMMWRGSMAQALNEKSSDSEMLNGYLFLSPNLLGFLLFFAGPLIFSLYISFTNSDAFGTQDFIGLENYREIFNLEFATLESPDQLASEAIDVSVYDELTRFSVLGQTILIGAQDKLFWIALRNTLVFVLLAVPLAVAPALLLATVLNSAIPGMKVFRGIYFLPSIAAVVGVALIWQWLYNSTVGWINYLLSIPAGWINTLAGSTVIESTQIGWLSDTNIALFSVVIIAAWQWMGFNTILYLAGLQNIPKVLYEAATIDGAGAVSQFWRITVPLLAPTSFFVIATTTIQAMQIFDQVFVLTTPPGGPGTSTTTMVLYLYSQGFRNFRQGYASSIAWVLFLLIFGLTLIQFQRQRGSTTYDS